MSALPGLRVVASSIHGYGAIATRRFHAGEVICHGDGVLYREDDEFDDTYALVLDGDGPHDGERVYLDLVDQTRWINHACDPNSEICSQWDEATRELRAWWVALRDIEVGEEITYDYGFCAEVAEPCACGSPRCRGVIVDDDPAELAKLPERLRAQLRDHARARAAS